MKLVKFIVLAAVAGIAATGIYLLTGRDSPVTMTEQTVEQTLKTGDKPASHGSYTNYSPQTLQAAQADKIVLFFHKARICPICAQIESNLQTSGVPAGLTVLKVDYDSHSDLISRYNVPGWYTFVQVDSDGNAVQPPWRGTYGTDGADIFDRAV
ncbi:MAG TPA: hypothetical protein VGA08_03355 [Candidatus Saccharimonadales bacterium]